MGKYFNSVGKPRFSLFIFYLALKMCLPKEESDKNTASLLAKKGTN